MTLDNNPESPSWGRLFAAVAEKHNAESASGKLTVSRFPNEQIQNLPGYKERLTPRLSKSDVSRELARYIAEYAEKNGKPLRYSQCEIQCYLFIQAERDMLPWERILTVVRAGRKQDLEKPIAHYFGYRPFIETRGKAGKKTLIMLVCYIGQEGICTGCMKEFHFDEFTLDHIKPRSANGALELTNAQLMCQPCNNEKGSKHD